MLAKKLLKMKSKQADKIDKISSTTIYYIDIPLFGIADVLY